MCRRAPADQVFMRRAWSVPVAIRFSYEIRLVMRNWPARQPIAAVRRMDIPFNPKAPRPAPYNSKTAHLEKRAVAYRS